MTRTEIKIRSLYNKGYSCRDIGAELNLSSTRIWQILNNLGVKMRPQGAPLGNQNSAGRNG